MADRAVFFHPSKKMAKGSPLKIAQWTTTIITAQKKKNLQNYCYLLTGWWFFSLFIVAHDAFFFFNTELFAWHRGHPPVLVNQLHSFHVLVSICKSLLRGVKRLLCNKFLVWKMKHEFQLLEHYFFQVHGKQELFWGKKWGTKQNTYFLVIHSFPKYLSAFLAISGEIKNIFTVS